MRTNDMNKAGNVPNFDDPLKLRRPSDTTDTYRHLQKQFLGSPVNKCNRKP